MCIYVCSPVGISVHVRVSNSVSVHTPESVSGCPCTHTHVVAIDMVTNVVVVVVAAAVAAVIVVPVGVVAAVVIVGRIEVAVAFQITGSNLVCTEPAGVGLDAGGTLQSLQKNTAGPRVSALPEAAKGCQLLLPLPGQRCALSSD